MVGRVVGARSMQILADHDESDAGGAEVLLGAGVDQAELRNVDRAAEDVAGHVSHERGLGLGELLHLRAGDGFVGGHVHVGRAGGVGQGVIVRQGGGNVLGGVCEDVDGADLLGFLDGLVGPGAGVDVVGGLVLAPSRFIGICANWRLAPPCRNRTW
jgi:hypothetical protein